MAPQSGIVGLMQWLLRGYIVESWASYKYPSELTTTVVRLAIPNTKIKDTFVTWYL